MVNWELVVSGMDVPVLEQVVDEPASETGERTSPEHHPRGPQIAFFAVMPGEGTYSSSRLMRTVERGVRQLATCPLRNHTNRSTAWMEVQPEVLRKLSCRT